MIPEAFVQDVLARIDIVDVVGRYVQLRKGGANLLGLCPFHNEKSPSFTVSPTKQFYHCFGCGAHGSAITFLIEHTGASFPEAVRALASSIGLSVPEESRSPRQQVESARRKAVASRHGEILEAAHTHYLRQLRGFAPAMQYLTERGLTAEIVTHFGLGWSGTDRHGLSRIFPHYDDPALVETGLVIESDDGRRYDRFRERIIFPIRNTRGALIGFGGRVIGKGEPKYLNSPETPVFSKGQELYGLWEARQAIRQEGQVIVVEGYMDVVGLAQQGIANAVATLGTATTPDHLKRLLRASDKIVFSFDGDTAGRRAAWRALLVCLPLLRDDIAIRFLFLPAEHDPDSYVRDFGPQAFRASLVEASALSRFLLDELASRHNLNEPEGRASCLYEAKPLLAAIPQCALRLQIERELARQVQLTPEEMASLLAQQPARPLSPLSPAGRPSPADDGDPWQLPAALRVAPPEYGPDNDFISAGGGSSAPSHRFWRNQRKPGYIDGKSRRRDDGTGGYAGRRTFPSLVKQLIRLLLTHPELMDGMGDQQLEVLDYGPHLGLVRELIVLAQTSGARHVGALLEAADPSSDLAQLLRGVRADLLAQEDLPEPQAEWDDALRRIELDAIKAEMASLAAVGLPTQASRERYRELSLRMSTLNKGGI
jgi:DNA primase